MILQKIHNSDSSLDEVSVVCNAIQQSLSQPISISAVNSPSDGDNFLIIGYIHSVYNLIQRGCTSSKVLYLQDVNSHTLVRVILLNDCAREVEEAGAKEVDLLVLMNPRFCQHPALEYAKEKVFSQQIILDNKTGPIPSMWIYQQVQCDYVKRMKIKHKHLFAYKKEDDSDLGPPPCKKLLPSHVQSSCDLPSNPVSCPEKIVLSTTTGAALHSCQQSTESQIERNDCSDNSTNSTEFSIPSPAEEALANNIQSEANSTNSTEFSILSPAEEASANNIQSEADSPSILVSCSLNIFSQKEEDAARIVKERVQSIGSQLKSHGSSEVTNSSPGKVYLSHAHFQAGSSSASESCSIETSSKIVEDADPSASASCSVETSSKIQENASTSVQEPSGPQPKCNEDSVNSNSIISPTPPSPKTLLQNAHSTASSSKTLEFFHSMHIKLKNLLDSVVSPVPSAKNILPEVCQSAPSSPSASDKLSSELVENISKGAQGCGRPTEMHSKTQDCSEISDLNSVGFSVGDRMSNMEIDEPECPQEGRDPVLPNDLQRKELASQECSKSYQRHFEFKQLASIKEGEVIHTVVVIQTVKRQVLSNSCIALVSVGVTDESIFPNVIDIIVVTHVKLQPLLKKNDIAIFQNLHISSADGLLTGKVFSGDDVTIYKKNSLDEAPSIERITPSVSDSNYGRLSKLVKWQKQIKSRVRQQMVEVFGEFSDDQLSDIEDTNLEKQSFNGGPIIEKLVPDVSPVKLEHVISSELVMSKSSSLSCDKLFNLECKVCNIFFLPTNKAVIHVEVSTSLYNESGTSNIPKKSEMKKLLSYTNWLKYLINSKFTGSLFFFVESQSAPSIIYSLKPESQLQVMAANKNEQSSVNYDFDTFKCDLKVLNCDTLITATNVSIDNHEAEVLNSNISAATQFNKDAKVILKQLVVKKSPSPQRKSSPVKNAVDALKVDGSPETVVRDVKVLLIRNPKIENLLARQENYLQIKKE